MTQLQVLEKHFKRTMKNKDFEAFKKSHPTLLKVIEDSMSENRLVYQLFVGKVVDEIGFERATELLKESKQEHAKL